MAERTTKKCPHCGAVLASFEAKRQRYGEMVKICYNCGNYYADEDYYEPALYTKGRRIGAGLAFGTVSMAIIALLVAAALSAVDDVVNLGGVFNNSFGIVFLVSFGLLEFWNLRSVFANEKSFLEEREMVESYKRLCNPTYRMQIEKLGYTIDPNCYYFKIKEKKEHEEAHKNETGHFVSRVDNESDHDVNNRESATNAAEHSEEVDCLSKIPVKELQSLKHLYDAGIITEEEFTDKKRKLLDL